MIPPFEEWYLGLHVHTIVKLLTRPERGIPETMKGLDLIVALRVIERCEQRLNTTEQTQTDNLADYARMRVPTTKCTMS